MHAPHVLAFLCLLWSCAGCRKTSPDAPETSTEGSSPRSAFGLVPPGYAADHSEPGTKLVTISARFLSAPRGALDGIAAAQREMLDADSLREIDSRIDSGKVISMAAPTLHVHPGQRSHNLIMNQAAFIQDLKLVGSPDAGPVVVDPTLSVLNTGSVLDIEADLDGDEIVFSHLEPQLVLKLGSRSCIFTVQDAAERVPSEEPVLLKATARRQSVRMPGGGSLLVPLDAEVQQGTCQARALGGPFEESYTPAPRTWGEGPREFFVVLTASVAPLDR